LKSSVPLLHGGRDDIDDTPPAPSPVLDRTLHEGEECVIATATHAIPWVKMGASLADDDLTGVDALTAIALDAQPLGVGVAAVLGGCRALLVCQRTALARVNLVLLPVTLTWVYV
jgi:hypothetical protein